MCDGKCRGWDGSATLGELVACAQLGEQTIGRRQSRAAQRAEPAAAAETAQYQLRAVGERRVADRAAPLTGRSIAAVELRFPGVAIERGELVERSGKPGRDQRASAPALDQPELFAHSPALRATRHARITPIVANNALGVQAASRGSSRPSAASSSPRVIEA